MDPKELLSSVFGFSDFRPGQKAVMSALWRKGAALAVFPTGGGKSLCYQLPALMFEGVTLVVSPLIALMKDQIDFLRSKGVSAARIDSSLTADENYALSEKLRTGKLKILSMCRLSGSITSASSPTCKGRGSRYSRWTRRTASPNGVITSGRTTSSWPRWPAAPARNGSWRLRPRRLRRSWKTSAGRSEYRTTAPS